MVAINRRTFRNTIYKAKNLARVPGKVIDKNKKPKFRTQSLVNRITHFMDKGLNGHSLRFMEGNYTNELIRTYFTGVNPYGDYQALFKADYRYGSRLQKFVKRFDAWFQQQIAEKGIDGDLTHTYYRKGHSGEQLSLNAMVAKMYQCAADMQTNKRDGASISEDIHWQLTNISQILAHHRYDELVVAEHAEKLAIELSRLAVTYRDFSGEATGFADTLNKYLAKLHKQGLSQAGAPALLAKTVQHIADKAGVRAPDFTVASVEDVVAYMTTIVHQMVAHRRATYLSNDLERILQQSIAASLKQQLLTETLQAQVDYLTQRGLPEQMIQRMLHDVLTKLTDEASLGAIDISELTVARTANRLMASTIDLSQPICVVVPKQQQRMACAMFASSAPDAVLGQKFEAPVAVKSAAYSAY